MTELQEYAKKIPTDAGCNEYTYGGEQAKYIMDDLKEAYQPGELKYPYINVANAILEMSKPRLITKAPFKMVWDTDSCCDSSDCDSFEEAKARAEDTLVEWMEQERSTWKNPENPTDEEVEKFDYMILNSGVWIDKYNPETDEYEKYAEFTQDELDELGWITYQEEE